MLKKNQHPYYTTFFCKFKVYFVAIEKFIAKPNMRTKPPFSI